MDNTAAKLAPLSPDPTLSGAAFRPAAPPAESSQPAAKGSDEADLRLVIEEDPASGAYVYKTIDRRTGEVLQQIPRDEVLRRHHADGPTGSVINTRA